ncbi:MAG TPA: hypothetical protein VEY89_09560, partial [Candidatus Dormibacteraeota bacterium]|nr:hypothetical protein [Candidatus Dormibacteraeota bacterium]
MDRPRPGASWLIGVTLAILAPLHASAQSPATSAAAAPGRFIVKLRPNGAADAMHADPERIGALAARAGVRLGAQHHIVSGIHLLRVPDGAAEADAAVLARLRADP